MLTTSFMEHIYLRSPTNMGKEFKVVTEEEILNITNKLDSKSTSGCNGLSNTMVKSSKNELYMPLYFDNKPNVAYRYISKCI